MATEEISAGLVPARPGFDTRLAEAGFVLVLLLIIVGLTPFDRAHGGSHRGARCGIGPRRRTAPGRVPRHFRDDPLWRAAQARPRGGPRHPGADRTAAALVFRLRAMDGRTRRRGAPRGAGGDLRVLHAARGRHAGHGAHRRAVARHHRLRDRRDLISVVLVHNAIHQPDDLEAGLAGAWRGLHSHKNMAGSVAASAVAMFFYFWLDTRRRSDLLFCLASLLFLVMTRSKSSWGCCRWRSPRAFSIASPRATCSTAPLRRSRSFVRARFRRRRGARMAGHRRLPGGPAAFHRPRRDLVGRSRVHPRPSPHRFGLRYVRQYRSPVADLSICRRRLGVADRRGP